MLSSTQSSGSKIISKHFHTHNTLNMLAGRSQGVVVLCLEAPPSWHSIVSEWCVSLVHVPIGQGLPDRDATDDYHFGRTWQCWQLQEKILIDRDTR